MTAEPITSEVRTVSSTGAAKGVKPEAFDLIPPAPWRDLAVYYGVSPVDFAAAETWSAVFNYINDHLLEFWEGEDTDPHTGLPHLVSAGAGCFALADLFLNADRYTAVDDRRQLGFVKVLAQLPQLRTYTDSTGARYDLIPFRPLDALARHYGAGAAKYAKHNWAAGYEWSKPYAALLRHLWAFWNGEDIDAETGSPHIIAAAWHCLTMAEFLTTHPEFDDRPIRGTSQTRMDA